MDVVLDDVARIEEPDRLDVLLNGLVVLLLVEQLVRMLLDDLALDLAREVRLLRDRLSLRVVRLLHQVVDLDVVLHGVEADKLAIHSLPFIYLGYVVDTLLPRCLFNLNVDDVAIGRRIPIHGNLILEVVDRQLGDRLGARLIRNAFCHGLHFNDILFEEVDHLLVTLELMLGHVGLMALESMNRVLFLALCAAADNIHHEDSVAAVRDAAQEQLLRLEIVNLVRLHAPGDVVEKENPLFKQNIHLVVGLLAPHASRLLEDVQVRHFLPAPVSHLVDLDGALGDFFRQ